MESNLDNCSLGNLLAQLQCPFDRLHNAGNDAHFTLRAALLMASRGLSHSRCSILDRIARYPHPRAKMNCHERGALKQAKRRAKTKEYQSQFWDLAQQESICEERRVKKAEAERNRLI